MKKLVILLILISIFVLLAACKSREQDESGRYIKITPERAQEMIDTQDVLILDVRTQEEFNEGHIPNAILLPDFEISQNARFIINDKDQIVLVYCRSGRRSEESAKLLIEMGYTRIYDIGGIIDWDGEVITDTPVNFEIITFEFEGWENEIETEFNHDDATNGN